MDFEPKSEEDLQGDLCLPAGKYDFTVAEAVEKVSSSGNAMIELSLRVFQSDGSTRFVRDWLVASDASMSQMKVRHFCRSTGLLANYEEGTLTDDICVGVSGIVQTFQEHSDSFGTQARVRDYLLPEETPAAQTESLKKTLTDASEYKNPNPHRDNKGEVPF